MYHSNPQSVQPKSQMGKLNKGYVRHQVLGDGDCSYTAFGTTREKAYLLLIAHQNEIGHLLKHMVKEVLLSEREFYNYLTEQKLVASTTSYENMVSDINIDRYSQDLAVMVALIDYDVKENKLENGWGHPAILQALTIYKKKILPFGRFCRYIFFPCLNDSPPENPSGFRLVPDD